eukprot:TRINITY_DN1315_c0_g1_i1.p1 TRINITY_DN1315_c0_g1~~TRINITY_DN1315_c0_g1_i1.p1  ORF type:complete len:189 (-),score=63.80 TRINITY_DN1315_c0_g1_i1:255-770(-)
MSNLKTLVSLCLLFCLFSIVFSHPTYYNVEKKNIIGVEIPPFFSYHIHVMFLQNNNNSVSKALDLRQKYDEAFKTGPPCTDLFHNDQSCLFEPDFEPAGPFVAAQWAVFLLPEDFDASVKWFMANRGDFDILIHPNSGYELEDHSIWTLWGGQPWKIDLSIFLNESARPQF